MAYLAPRFYANIAPGQDFDQHSPNQFTPAYLDGWVRRLGGTRETLGLSFAFSLLNGPLPKIAAASAALRDAAQQSGIHIIPAFDIQNWWDYRSDLWNWFDPNRPGYAPANRDNVEWTGPDRQFATSIAWRNWGSQIRVAPPPNLRSKAFRAAGETALGTILKPWAEWQASNPYGSDVETPGIKLGWEASLGVNAYVYPGNIASWKSPVSSDPQGGLEHNKGLFGGLAPLGWAALHAAGKHLPTELQKTDIEWVVRDYLQWMVATARRCGVPEAQLFTHAGGQFAPFDQHIGHAVACVRGAAPGWSIYNTRPADAGDMVAAIGKRKDDRWCCAEWMSFAATPERWADDLEATLSTGNCRFVVAYNAQDILANTTANRGLALTLQRGKTCG